MDRIESIMRSIEGMLQSGGFQRRFASEETRVKMDARVQKVDSRKVLSRRRRRRRSSYTQGYFKVRDRYVLARTRARVRHCCASHRNEDRFLSKAELH